MGGSKVARLRMQHVPDAISQAMAVTKRLQRIALSSHRRPWGRHLIGTLARMAEVLVTRRVSIEVSTTRGLGEQLLHPHHPPRHPPHQAHPLKQRDPATSVAEPCSILVIVLAGPWTSRCALAHAFANNGAPICLDSRLLNATDQALLSSAFFSTPPWSLCTLEEPSMFTQPSHSLSRRTPLCPTAHLIPASFDSPEASPLFLRLEGSRPEVPYPCAFDLALGPC
ncbi:uncharacterized protein BDR25DRAFT_129127 [Lindgomyces ingoldianus]|uniref:Uncharacterized protein n=1 Tax=Lindgomyces ingoldianus TaxID=673940 RepID=A0ACB6R1L2_9PLEO|nr:uncharacterized protein BDR25DRAFT_129127 [Lindgomyces ingoldianus]KAF2473143.1 hypothetical protein BDR25DRAFT_129127 [Lindgomyces ingoldianus]